MNFNISANYKRALSLLQSWIWKLLFNFSFPTYHIEYPHVHALRGNERKEIDGKQRSLRTLWAPFDFVIDRFWLGILRLEDTLVMKPFIKSNHVFLQPRFEETHQKRSWKFQHLFCILARSPKPRASDSPVKLLWFYLPPEVTNTLRPRWEILLCSRYKYFWQVVS